MRSTRRANWLSTNISGSPPLRITSSIRFVGQRSLQGRLPLRKRVGTVPVGVMAAEAVAAMNGAGPRCDEQGSPAIFLQQSGGQCGPPIRDRVGRVSGGVLQLFGQRQHLPEKGVVRVAGVHFGDVAQGSEDGEQPSRASSCLLILGRQLQALAELHGRRGSRSSKRPAKRCPGRGQNHLGRLESPCCSTVTIVGTIRGCPVA